MTDLGIAAKFSDWLTGSAFDAVIAAGFDNVQYLSGALLPFAPYRPDQVVAAVWPRRGQPVLVCPEEWRSTAERTGWMSCVQGYVPHGDGLASAVGAIREFVPAGRIGVDALRTSQRLFDALQQSLPDATLDSCDDDLRALRMIKTPAEIELLIEAADRTDHGINACIHHVTVDRPRSELTLAEEIRVHCMERLLDYRGYQAASQVSCGETPGRIWYHAPKYGYSSIKAPEPLDAVQINTRQSLDGYWSDAARIMTMGEPTAAQTATYNGLISVRKLIIHHLVPGVRCQEVFRSVVDAADEAGIPLQAEYGLGHGVGVAASEPPFLADWDDTAIAADMVLVLSPVVEDPGGRLLQAKDTVVITVAGAKLVGWYRDWRTPYVPIASI
jgi:Xaa-Pro aminopeptidase